MRPLFIGAVLSASIVTVLALVACGDASSRRTRGHDGPCSDSYGFLDFAKAAGFAGAVSELELHLGDGFPAPPPPDWATQFAVARGTLLVAQTGADGNIRNVASPYKYGWVRYESDAPNDPSVMVGTREIPFCDAQLVALKKGRVSTSTGAVDVFTMFVGDSDDVAATALFQIDGEWTLVKIDWPDNPSDRDAQLKAWISSVIDAGG